MCAKEREKRERREQGKWEEGGGRPPGEMGENPSPPFPTPSPCSFSLSSPALRGSQVGWRDRRTRRASRLDRGGCVRPERVRDAMSNPSRPRTQVTASHAARAGSASTSTPPAAYTPPPSRDQAPPTISLPPLSPRARARGSRTGLDALHALADRLDDAGSLVTENAGEKTFRVEASERVRVGVAQGRGDDLNANLAWTRGGDHHGGHLERLFGLPGHGGLALDGLANGRLRRMGQGGKRTIALKRAARGSRTEHAAHAGTRKSAIPYPAGLPERTGGGSRSDVPSRIERWRVCQNVIQMFREDEGGSGHMYPPAAPSAIFPAPR